MNRGEEGRELAISRSDNGKKEGGGGEGDGLLFLKSMKKGEKGGEGRLRTGVRKRGFLFIN